MSRWRRLWRKRARHMAFKLLFPGIDPSDPNNPVLIQAIRVSRDLLRDEPPARIAWFVAQQAKDEARACVYKRAVWEQEDERLAST